MRAFGRRAAPWLLYSYPLSSWHSHYRLKGKILKQRGATPAGGVEDDFGNGFVGYGGFCKATIDMYGK
jgi:hypothetical protein